MKKLYLILSSFVLSVTVMAQPTLQYPQNAPSIGDVMVIQFVDTEGLTAGANGPGVTWDYSELTNILSPGQIIVISPAAAPAGGDFPEASIVFNMNDTIYTYADADQGGLYYQGVQVTSGQIPVKFVYSDYRTYLEFPLAFNDVFTDTYKGVSSVLMTEVRLSATATTTADAYGTLILPSGTFNNVLRVKTEDTEIDSIFLKGMFISVTITNRTQYHWFATDSKGPLFSMEVSDCSGTSDTTCYYTMQGSGTNEMGLPFISNMSVYPNPAAEELQVEFVTDGSTTVRLSLVNQIGQEMLGRTIDAGVPGTIMETIDVRGLPAGLYFASLRCDCGKQLTRKFVIR